MISEPFHKLLVVGCEHGSVNSSPTRIRMIVSDVGLSQLSTPTTWAPDRELVLVQVGSCNPQAGELATRLQTSRDVRVMRLIIRVELSHEFRVDAEMWIRQGLSDAVILFWPEHGLGRSALNGIDSFAAPSLTGYKSCDTSCACNIPVG